MSKVFQLSEQSAFNIVRTAAREAGLGHVAPHDLRRTASKGWLAGGASLEQISRTLGHGSLQVTQRYLGLELEMRPGLAATDMFDPTGVDKSGELNTPPFGGSNA